jgi:ketosteroid isomerase-like protein
VSQENVEIVRTFFAAVDRALQTWRPGDSVLDAMQGGGGDVPPEASAALGYLSPEVEWNPVFSGETYRGRLGLAKGWDDLLEAAGNYSIRLLEATTLDDDRVLAVFGPSLEGRGSGIHVDAAVFAVVTLQDRLIARVDEFTERREALEAAGLSE